MTRLAINGFGRIGRLLARQIILATGHGEQLRLKAIVIRPKLKDRKQYWVHHQLQEQ